MTRQLHLMVITFLLVSMNACIMANYQITAQDFLEKKAIGTFKDREVVRVVVLRYYNVTLGCRSGGGNGWLALVGLVNLMPGACQHESRDFIGTQMYVGVAMALHGNLEGKAIEFQEHIPSQGSVCVVTINEQIDDDFPYSEILSLVTLFTIPAYTTHRYILSYSLLDDFKTIKEYEYHITEKAIEGWGSWLLYPIMHRFWDEIKFNFSRHGPRASVIYETTNMFLREAHRDGIL